MAELGATTRGLDDGPGITRLSQVVAGLRGTFLAVAVLVLTFALLPVQAMVLGLLPRLAHHIPLFYHRAVMRLLDIRIDVEGELAQGPVLLVANHASWLDIPVIGSLDTLTFVAKQEVAGWPLFGWLAKLQRTVFVNRERRTETRTAKNELERRLDRRERLVLFAEGTSSDGNRVLPFRTALFGAAVGEVTRADGSLGPVPVQPLSIAYTRLHGLPIGRQYRPRFAWYGDMAMGPHLWGVLCSGPVDVRIVLHRPVTIDEFENRKAMARACEATVRAGVLGAILGRPVSGSRPANLS